jgi:hypothetical protein
MQNRRHLSSLVNFSGVASEERSLQVLSAVEEHLVSEKTESFGYLHRHLTKHLKIPDTSKAIFQV